MADRYSNASKSSCYVAGVCFSIVEGCFELAGLKAVLADACFNMIAPECLRFSGTKIAQRGSAGQ